MAIKLLARRSTLGIVTNPIYAIRAETPLIPHCLCARSLIANCASKPLRLYPLRSPPSPAWLLINDPLIRKQLFQMPRSDSDAKEEVVVELATILEIRRKLKLRVEETRGEVIQRYLYTLAPAFLKPETSNSNRIPISETANDIPAPMTRLNSHNSKI